MARAHVFTHPIHVRYLEVDQQGVVFNMWYLAYFDDAMTAYLESRGVGYQAMLDDGLDVQLVHSSIDWRGGLRFGDQAHVAVRTVALGTTSVTLGFEVHRAGQPEPLVGAEIVYVCVATDGSGKRELPPSMRAALA